ncbi:MAG: hypothetical protein ACREMU_00380, partial [Gemmatimonadaceae bacterium]
LMQAADIEGMDAELALLRVRLRDQVEAHGDDFDVLLKGVRLISQALTTRYRISTARSSELADTLASVVRQVGGQFFPEQFDDL